MGKQHNRKTDCRGNTSFPITHYKEYVCDYFNGTVNGAFHRRKPEHKMKLLHCQK